MAQLAGQELAESGRTVRAILSSPLERAQESAEPISALLNLPVTTDESLIEAASHLEGGRYQMDLGILTKPAAWRYLVNPLRPSWGESFSSVAGRVTSLLIQTAAADIPGDVVMVSHQLPIWMAHRVASGRRLFHDPRKRRCSLSSITSFEVVDGRLVEVAYAEPASRLTGQTRDVGAV